MQFPDFTNSLVVVHALFSNTVLFDTEEWTYRQTVDRLSQKSDQLSFLISIWTLLQIGMPQISLARAHVSWFFELVNVICQFVDISWEASVKLLFPSIHSILALPDLPSRCNFPQTIWRDEERWIWYINTSSVGSRQMCTQVVTNTMSNIFHRFNFVQALN